MSGAPNPGSISTKLEQIANVRRRCLACRQDRQHRLRMGRARNVTGPHRREVELVSIACSTLQIRRRWVHVQLPFSFMQFCWSPETADQGLVREWVEKLQRARWARNDFGSTLRR
jgi:hypothetical protein